jgi:hypothetical protein
MSTKEQQLQQWTNETKLKLAYFLNEIEKVPEAYELMKGFEVWDSPVFFNPKIMFMGINPGTGNPNIKVAINTDGMEEISYLHYKDGDNHYNYPLANTTYKILYGLGYSHEQARTLLSKSVKTNFFFIATATVADIQACFRKVSKELLDEYMPWQYNAINELIEIIAPEIIICEGVKAYDHVLDGMYPEDKSFPLGEETLYFETPKVKVAGYRRNFSTISEPNLEEIVGILKHAGVSNAL